MRPSKRSKPAESSRSVVGVCLVGSGRMGKVRAPLLRAHPHAVILWVVDVSEASGKPMAADHDCASFTTDIRVALADERVDLVWVTTPTFAHLDVIKRSAAAGRCIFTEKPVAEEPFAIRDAFAAAEACGVALYCGFQRRFDSGYARVRELVAAGKIGKVNFIRVCFADSPAPPIEFMLKGGCPFLDLAPHDIDWIRWTLNEEPTSVYAIGSSSSPALAAAGVLDAATMTLSFASGAVAQIVMTRRSAYGYDNRVEVIGELGKLEVSTPPKTSVVHASAAGIATDVLQFSFPQRFHDAFAAEVDAAVRCVCDRKKYAALGLALGADAATWPITFRDCIMAQTVAMAAARSQKLGAPLAISAPVPCSAAIPSADQRVALRPIGNGGFGAYIHALVQRDARLRAHFDVGAPYTRSSGLEWERDVLASAQLEAVYVCSPDALHRTHAMECLNAGLHVLVEKPVRMDGDAPFNERHFNDVADVALAKKRVVMVGLHRRFDAEFMRLRAEVRRRWAARSAFAVHIESRDPCPAESDDKAQFVLYNSCVHDVDMIAWLFPAECGAIDVASASYIEGVSGFEIALVITSSDASPDTSPESGGGSDAPFRVHATISYSKKHESYVQRASIRGAGAHATSPQFGYDHWGVFNGGEGPAGLYEDAYVAEWLEFHRRIRRSTEHDFASAERAHLASYTRSFALLAAVERALGL